MDWHTNKEQKPQDSLGNSLSDDIWTKRIGWVHALCIYSSMEICRKKKTQIAEQLGLIDRKLSTPLIVYIAITASLCNWAEKLGVRNRYLKSFPSTACIIAFSQSTTDISCGWKCPVLRGAVRVLSACPLCSFPTCNHDIESLTCFTLADIHVHVHVFNEGMHVHVHCIPIIYGNDRKASKNVSYNAQPNYVMYVT